MIQLVIDVRAEDHDAEPLRFTSNTSRSTALLSSLDRIKGYLLQSAPLPEGHVLLPISPLLEEDQHPQGEVFLLFFYGDHSWLYTPTCYTLSEDRAKQLVADLNRESIPTTQFDNGHCPLRPYPESRGAEA